MKFLITDNEMAVQDGSVLKIKIYKMIQTKLNYVQTI